jgi:hypothetical protein
MIGDFTFKVYVVKKKLIDLLKFVSQEVLNPFYLGDSL